MNAAMEASVTGNGVLFFWAILLGAAWGILYDVFRVIRIARGSSCTADKFAAVKRLRAVQLHLPEMRRRSMPSKKKKKSERQKLHITDTVVVFVEDLLFTLHSRFELYYFCIFSKFRDVSLVFAGRSGRRLLRLLLYCRQIGHGLCSFSCGASPRSFHHDWKLYAVSSASASALAGGLAGQSCQHV